ncbi:MAG: alkaline phosphatase family protein [Myxococcales bacterium]
MTYRTALLASLLAAAVACSSKPSAGDAGAPAPFAGGKIHNVFLILMENHNWSDIYQSSSAPYINGTLLPEASYATQYFNPPGNHPSEPNYLWLEAGTNDGKGTDDGDPSKGGDEMTTTQHLATLLGAAGLGWKDYAEDIDGGICPLTSIGLFACKHDPFLYFDDITGGLNPQDPTCIAHNRPFGELASDLTGTLPSYSFITPNLTDDMHNSTVSAGDNWLAAQLPALLGSAAYKAGGAVFITWDEGEGGDGPIGMIVLSPFAKGGGYHNAIHYDHSSMVKTVEEIFGLSPLVGHAADSSVNDLSDLFND